MDAPTPATTPPTTPGAIPGPREGRLTAAAKLVAWLDIAFGAFMLAPIGAAPRQPDPYALAMGVMFLLFGIGLLLRSNIARILSRLAHGLMGGLMILGSVFVPIGFMGSGGQGPMASGGFMAAMVAFMLAWMLGLAAFFVWSFLVLGRKDVRAACRRHARHAADASPR